MGTVDRNYLIKLDNAKQADEVFDVLHSLGEPIRTTTFIYNPNWCYVGFYNNTDNWTISNGSDNFGSNVISFENFMKTFSSKDSVKKLGESSTKVDMKAIQEECKRRFPIGCTYQCVGDKVARLLKEDYSTYDIYGDKHIYAHEGGGCLYKDGKYATLVSLPEEKKPSIPEYVECISKDFSAIHLGTIYKLESRSSSDSYYLKDVNMGSYSSYHFKPSTKEAYDAQFTTKSVKEWEPGTYAVGLKGNFGVFNGSRQPVHKGKIYTIKNNREDCIGLEESQFWVYKENLKWFATKQEAESFARTLTESSKVPIYTTDVYGDPKVKTKPLIEDVQSVSVNLRTKKNNNKFKF